MYEKSFVSVKHMLWLALAVILVIGVLTAASIILPGFATGPVCVTAQGNHIRDMNGLADDVKLDGQERSNVKFRVEYCVECIWYNSTTDMHHPWGSLAVIYSSNPSQPINYAVTLAWQGIESDQNTCSGSEKLTGGKTCTFDITLQSVKFVTGSC